MYVLISINRGDNVAVRTGTEDEMFAVVGLPRSWWHDFGYKRGVVLSDGLRGFEMWEVS